MRRVLGQRRSSRSFTGPTRSSRLRRRGQPPTAQRLSWSSRAATRQLISSRVARTSGATLRELLPAVAEALTPPAGADASILGASADELRAFALDGLTRQLNIIGVPLETL